jgi:hypothetical protein
LVAAEEAEFCAVELGSELDAVNHGEHLGHLGHLEYDVGKVSG